MEREHIKIDTDPSVLEAMSLNGKSVKGKSYLE